MQTYILVSCDYDQGVEWLGHTMFDLLRNERVHHFTIFEYYTKVPVPLHPCRSVLSACFLIAILVCMKWYLSVAWIYISLVPNDFECLLVCLLVT